MLRESSDAIVDDRGEVWSVGARYDFFLIDYGLAFAELPIRSVRELRKPSV